MTLDGKIRKAATETRETFSGRRHPPIARIANRALVRHAAAMAVGALFVLGTVGVAGWMALGGSGSAATAPPETAAATLAPVPSTSPEASNESVPATTMPPTTVPADDGLSDPSAIPDAWSEGLPEGSRALLMDSGIALIAHPWLETDGGGWYLTMMEAARFNASFNFGPADEEYVEGELAEIYMMLSVDDESQDAVVSGLAPLDTTTITLTFGEAAPITIDRVFPRPGVDRAAFVASIPVSVFDQEGPITVEFDAFDASGDVVPHPEVTFHGSSVNDAYAGPITSELFIIPPPLIADSITADTLPDVGLCQGGPGVEVPPNQGREISDGKVLPTARGALEAILADELSDSWYPHGDYVEIGLPDGSVAFAVPFDGDLANGAVMLIEVAPLAGGWTVTAWEGSGC